MKIVFATNNKHKLDEIRAILGENIEVLSLNDIGCHDDIPETGQTLEENAMQKADYIFKKYHVDVFADDTGLEVEALNGAPGVFSARYAGGEGHDSEANMTKLLKELDGNDNRKAQFRTVIALISKLQDDADSEQNIKYFEGIVNGEIIRERRGGEGFGYDPIFQPDGYQETFAELGTDIKNTISHRARATEKLAKYLSTLLLLLFAFLPLQAQIGTWKNYLAYHDIQSIEEGDNNLFVCASKSLFQYNLQDQSIVTFDRTNGMSDTDISLIKWCPQAKRLIVVYSNTNIDLIDLKGNVVNISDIYQKAITGNRNINNIYISGQYAYLSCGYGIVKLNVKDAEISETYMLNLNVAGVIVKNNYLYAKIRDTYVFYYLRAPLSSNMIDVNNWQRTGDNYAAEFEADNTTYNKYYETVSKLNPGGPKYNHFFNLKIFNNKLYTVGGGWYQFANYERPGTVQVLDGNDNWEIYQDDFQLAFASKYKDVNDIVVDPNNANHVMVASCSGIIEFLNGKYQNNYTDGNTECIKSATGDGNPEYVRTDGIIYDNQGVLYALNSASDYAIIKRNTNGEWSGFINDKLKNQSNKSMQVLKGTMIDSKGRMWFCNAHTNKPALIQYDTETQKVVLYNTFRNQDNTDINLIWVTCVCEDLNGNIWIGTDKGPFYLTEEEQADNTKGFIQHKVPRNDGTNYADYLLAGIQINSIVVDKAGRKWLATEGNGVYLISEDNNTQEQHFTTENSYLLSDIVESLAINDETGVVYFGTTKGLCSYVSDATKTNEEMTTDNVWAYPNPVTPEYTGLITITGLSYQADVKIMNASGKLVAEGRSNGGTFTWNGCDENGNRVGSGIYMVAAATKEGKKGTVCKIAVIR